MPSKTQLVMGFDFGMKYIGVATGQQLSVTATPLTCLTAKDGIPNWQQIQDLVAAWRPQRLIVGIPLNMDGSKQQLTYCAEKFANRLHQYTKLPVARIDECLSTWEAKQRLLATSKRSKLNLQKVNAVAAAILVEQWLQDQRGKPKD